MIARYIYEKHNEVNERLNKPKFGLTWRDSLKERRKWPKHLFVFLFAIVWIYPEKNPEEATRDRYEFFFEKALASILFRTEFSSLYSSSLFNLKRSLGKREDLFRWIYGLREKCLGPGWTREDVISFLDALKARNNCEETRGCQ